MNSIKHTYTLLLIFSAALFYSQEKRNISGAASGLELTVAKPGTTLSDKDQMPVNLKGAHYNPEKKNLPYFLDMKHSAQAQYTPILKNVQVITLPSDLSSRIITAFKPYLSEQFSLEPQYGVSGNDNITYARITPYRLTKDNSIEELVSYEIDWQEKEMRNAAQKTAEAAAFKPNSVLASGQWFKIGILKNGVYKLDRGFLQSIGFDVNSLDPANLRVYGNGGHMLPELNSAARYDDLEENAISFVGNSDNSFDNNEYFVFYGAAADQWNFDKSHAVSCLTFNHQLNLYSDTSYYFLTADLGAGKRIANRASSLSAPVNTVTTYDYYDYHEINTTNFIKSGREFYGEYFDINNSYSFTYPINNLVVGDTVSAFAEMAARGASPTNFQITYSGTSKTFSVGGINVNDYLGDYVALCNNCSKTVANNTSVLSFNLTKLTPSNLAWLDRLTFNCRRNLTFNNAQFNFRDSRSFRFNRVSKFVLNTNTFSNISVWDVTDPINPVNQQYNSGSGQIDFTTNNFSLLEFVVFNGSDFMTPHFVGRVANQNLHATPPVDFLIVTYPGFESQAQRLALLHQQVDTLKVSVVTTDQVYNEFSSGRPDISAIRDFARMLYVKHASTSTPLKYLLLFGDGSYRVKDRFSYGNTSNVPVYEVGVPKYNSYSPILSTVSDDFFGWLDPEEGEDWTSGLVDIGVGRFPVKNASEATAAVSKVEAYYSKNYNFSINDEASSCDVTSAYPLGDWRNWVCFIADDEDYQTHLGDAESLSNKVKTKHPEYNVDKIYSDAFLQYVTPGGERYPDVNSEIDHRFRRGALVMNYTGHGGEIGLGHERFIEISQIQSYKNKNNLPLMVTATCEFARFDDPDRTSAGELCFLNPDGAAIALLTTVRLAFSNTNLILNTNLYEYIFDTLPNGKMPALGDVVKLTKVKSGISFYYLNFHLLGDPALRLAYPQQKVFTSSINGNTVTTSSTDTMKALAKVTIKGYVGDKSGNKLTSFNGILYPTVFDKQQKITCLGNDPSSITSGGPFQFMLQKNIIYKGKVQVTNGDFTFSFIVPKDISYSFDKGKLSYYAHNGVVDAHGYSTNFYIGGSATNVTPDNAGPAIGLYMNDKKFVSGGTTNEKPNLYAEVVDSSGINTVGTGIGHDITAVLDENSSKPVILNDYYEANLNSYQSGKIKYPFSELSEGNHRLSLKVWDVQNNSSIAYTDFVVAKSAEMALTHVLNYPNPFTTRTKFFFENNQCCNTLKVNIQIFTISGKVVKTISQSIRTEGFRSDGIDWDGKDDFGDKLAKGVYIYKLSISDAENKKAEKTEKLVILN